MQALTIAEFEDAEIVVLNVVDSVYLTGLPEEDLITKSEMILEEESKKVTSRVESIIKEIEEVKEWIDNFDIDAFNESLGDDYVLFIKLHPNYNSFADKEHFIDLESVENEHEFVNCTQYSNEQELLLLSDVLITDYSSIMIEFAILDKPILFFVYDLDNYLSIVNKNGYVCE